MLKENISRKHASVAAGQYIKEKKYWMDNLSGDLVKSTFPYDYYKKKSVPDTPGENEPRLETGESRVSGELFSRLMRLSNNSNVRLHIVLAAGIVVLLEKYTGNNDIIVGVPIYKQRTEGKFVNTALALRNKLEENITFKELLLQLRQTISKANENLNYPVETLLYQLNIPFSRDDDFPLFDIGILLENVHHRHYFKDINLNMIFNFHRTDECINVHIEYNSLLYKKNTVQGIMAHLKNFLERVLPDGLNLSVEEIDILSEKERRQVLVEFNQTAQEYPKDKTIHGLFEEQVEKTPYHAAVVGASVTSKRAAVEPVTTKKIHYISYKKLNENANRLAAQLRRAGVKPGKIVAVMMERTVEMSIAIFGVLKAGGAYLPISTDAPRKRVQAMLQDCQTSIILTMSGIFEKNVRGILQDSRSNEIIPFKTGTRPQIKDFDNLPFPDRSLVNYEKYNEYISQALVKNCIALQTTRGCPYRCLYCHKIWPKKCVTRSAENIFAEVKQYYDIGVRRFVFVDDIFNFNKKNSSRFFELVIKNGLDIHLFFSNGLRGDLLTKEYIDLMVEAGSVEVALALETASPRLQKLIKKNLDLEKLRENIGYFTGKYPHVILELLTMHGFPTETEEEAMKTLAFIKSIKWLHFAYVSVLKVYPGTDMEKLALENGISREAIAASDHLATHELPDTLPFDKSFTLRYQSDFLNNYILTRERLLHVLPHQMKFLTKNEMVQKYNSFLPVDIGSFADLLDFTGITREELSPEDDGFVDEAKNTVPGLNLKMKKYSPLKESSEKALKILLLDLSQFFTVDAHKLYDVVEPPLGAMYLLTYLNHRFGNKINGRIAKSRVDFDNYLQLYTLLEEFKPDVIGIRTLSFFKDFFHKTVAMIRQWGIDVPIISGGPYATSSYRTILQDRGVDLVVMGEGEVTFSEVIEKIIENEGKLPEQKELENIPGIAFIPAKPGLEQRGQPPVMMLDTLNEVAAGESNANLKHLDHPDDLAYVIFTSGSTGKPKGTMMEHKSINNLVYGLKSKIYKYYSGHLKVSIVAPFQFDASVQQIFGALLQGHTLYIIPEDTRIDGAGLLGFYRKYNINISDGTPTHIRLLLENIEGKIYLPFIKHFIIAGEVFPREIAAGFLQCFRENIPGISNLYGPTETCVDSTYYHISSAALEMLRTIPIGKPLSNQQAYIVDKENQLQPIGVVGDLYIGGDGVARGYLNNPELTAEKFNHDLWDHLDYQDGNNRSYITYKSYLPGKLYKTGDLARWLADGDIEFLGRIDHQVKIRGFRIELGDIESQLRAHGSIKDAVVIPLEDEQGDRLLCAYYIEKTGEGIECWPSVGEYFVWDDLLYYAMTNDKPRNRSYKVAIEKLVRDKTVVEIGTGPDAILARFCAQAGVNKVYAIEILEESYKKARETVRRLNLEEKITVIHGDAAVVQLPEKVDVCLSQIIGNIASSEGAIHILNNAWRFLKENGVMIPGKCRTKIAAVQLPEEVHENPGFSEISKIYPDKIFKAFGYKFDFRLCVKNFPQSAVISNVETFENLDFSGKIPLENTRKVNFTIRGNARIDGFLLWINLYTMKDELIDTSENKYVWSPVFIPVFYPGVDVSLGDMIRAECIRNVSNNNICPDYKIKGVLIFKNGEDLEFEYDFPYQVRTYRKNPFYQTLFKDGSINVLENRQAGMSVSELKEYLQRELPDHMIPTYFVQLEEIPLAHNGKVDRKALPRPELVVEGEYAAARHELDKKLIEIWSEVLVIEKDIIGIDSNFFRMGGHSLKATRLVSKIHKELNVKLPLVEIFTKATVRGLSDYLAGVVRDRFASIPAAEAKKYYAASSAQKRLYILHQVNRENTSYNMPTIVSLEGNIEKDRFETIFRRLIQRHEIFRTSFEMIEGKPVQQVRDVVEFAVEYHAPRRDMQPRDIIDHFIKPFDLSHAPLMRVGLIDTKEENILMLDMHHIISDGTSGGIFVKEFTALYKGENLPSLRIQYKDYSQWQNSEEQTRAIKRQEQYWRKKFEIEPPVLTLPTDYARPMVQDFEGSTRGFVVAPEQTAQLKTLALKEETTMFMVLLAIFNVFLAKISGRQDIVVGTGIEGRRHEDLHQVVGMFVNTLALRSHPQPGISFLELLKQIKKNTLEAFENQDYQFENLVEQITVRRDTSRNPLFDVMFQLDNLENRESANPGSSIKHYPYQKRISKFDMTLFAKEAGKQLFFSIEYSTKLFKEETIQWFVTFFKEILKTVTRNPARKLAEIIEMPGERKKILLEQLNQELNQEVNIIKKNSQVLQSKWEKHINTCKDKIAIQMGIRAVTYNELERKANHIANWMIHNRSITKGTFIGILMENRLQLIVTVMGILKAGAVMVPLDPDYPGDRLRLMLDSTDVNHIIGDNDNLNRFLADDSFKNRTPGFIPIEKLFSPPASSWLTEPPGIRCQAEDSIYIYFTSGSTGTPRAMIGKNSGLVHFIDWESDTFGIDNTSRISQLTTPAFDAFLRDVFVPLLSGGVVCIPGSKDILLEADKLVEWIDQSDINGIHCVPTIFRLLNDSLKLSPGNFKNLKFILFSGEKLEPADLINWYRTFNDRIQLVNLWGTSETTLAKTGYFIRESDINRERIPVGKPMKGARVIIMDENMNLCDYLVPGKIYICTPFATKGYYNDPRLNHEKFIPGPFPGNTGHLLHDTGDRGKFLPDGNIDLLGRNDRQVKIQGIRIELEEIESVLSKHPQVKEAAAVKREIPGTNDLLYVYITGNETGKPGKAVSASTSNLKEYLSQKLPGYMVPAEIIKLEEMPRNPNGKIDYDALPDPLETPKLDYIPPRNDIQKRILKLWSEILGIEKISIDKSFFELGGNSLKIMSLISKIHKEFGVRISLGDIFNNPTIEKQAEILQKGKKETYLSIEAVEKKEYYVMSSAQKRLYILYQLDKASIAYNLPLAVEIEGEPGMEKMQMSFRKLIQRHESFRTSFLMLDQEPVQKIHHPGEIEFALQYRETDEPGTAGMINKFFRPFDLDKPPLMRAGIIKIKEKKYILQVDMHHIISDGTSDDIIIKDFMAFYRENQPGELRLQYKDFSEWEGKLTASGKMLEQEKFWLQQFEGEIPLLNLPQDYPRPDELDYKGDKFYFEPDPSLTDAVNEVVKETGSTLNIVLMAVYIVLLSKYSEQEDIVVGFGITGRTHVDLENVVGMFVNMMAIRNFPLGSLSFTRFVGEVKVNLLEAFENQDYQFEELVRKLGIQRHANRNPLFDTVFHFLDQTTKGTSPSNLKLKKHNFKFENTQFDIILTAIHYNEKLGMLAEYLTALFKPSTIQQIAKNYVEILEQLVENKGIKLEDITISYDLAPGISTLSQEEAYNFNF